MRQYNTTPLNSADFSYHLQKAKLLLVEFDTYVLLQERKYSEVASRLAKAGVHVLRAAKIVRSVANPPRSTLMPKFCKDCVFFPVHGPDVKVLESEDCMHPQAQTLNIVTGRTTTMMCSTMRMLPACGEDAHLFQPYEAPKVNSAT